MNKICKKCCAEKPTADFYRMSARKDGLMTVCKKCHQQNNKVWNAANKEKVKEIRAKSNNKFKKERADYRKKYHEANKERCAEAAKERSKKWRMSNRSQHREYCKGWAANNPEKVRAIATRFFNANREKVLTQLKEYKKAHPEKSREDGRKRYLGRNKEAYAYSLILRNDPCSYCGKTVEKICVDHIDPLSKGGANEWWNLTAACLSCNSSKRDKPLLTHLFLMAKQEFRIAE